MWTIKLFSLKNPPIWIKRNNMKSLLVLILISLGAGIVAFIFFLISGKNKQFEDIEGPKYRMMNDDEDDEPKYK